MHNNLFRLFFSLLPFFFYIGSTAIIYNWFISQFPRWRIIIIIYWYHLYWLESFQNSLSKEKKERKKGNEERETEKKNNIMKWDKEENRSIENHSKKRTERGTVYCISSSSYRAGSTDIPDPLSPLLPIVHRPR